MTSQHTHCITEASEHISLLKTETVIEILMVSATNHNNLVCFGTHCVKMNWFTLHQ